MKTAIDEALAKLRQTQDVTLIHVGSFLRNPSREAAARLDAAVEEEVAALEAIAAGRHDYVSKVMR